MRLLDRVAGRVEFIVQKYSARGWHDVTGGFERYQEAEQAIERLYSKRSRSKPDALSRRGLLEGELPRYYPFDYPLGVKYPFGMTPDACDVAC